MSKRRRGERHTYHQVPSLVQLATRAVRRNEGKHFEWNSRAWKGRVIMDTTMSESRSSGTQTSKRKRGADEGAEQVGMGKQITVPRNIPKGYNNNFTVCLSYADSRTIPIAYNAGYDTRTWATNSIYDPDVTATGHQPMLRDLWASQYDYYAVLACRYKLTFFNAAKDPITWTAVGTSAQLVPGVTITLLPTTNVSDIAAMSTGLVYPALEMKNTQSYTLFPEQSIVVEGELTPGDFLVDAKDEDNDNTWTAVGSNPGVLRYLGVSINSIVSGAFAGASETAYAAIQVVNQFEYDVQFTQMNQTVRSYPS